MTSKKILQRGQLQQRVTIIPINKITSRTISPNTVAFAQQLVGRQNVDSALSLIDYHPYFEPVMQFVFGHTLICRDMNIAKQVGKCSRWMVGRMEGQTIYIYKYFQVTYHRNIQCRTVTLDGDVVDPEGTLSGGSRPKGANILQELSEIKNMEGKIESNKNHLNNISQQLQ